jgi:hypothetical protein
MNLVIFVQEWAADFVKTVSGNVMRICHHALWYFAAECIVANAL